MKGYIYITGVGFDPASRGNLTDPSLFGITPTLGACMPNIRRFVDPGDHVFVVSGTVSGLRQYLIGGMRVLRKVDAREAHAQLPDHRLARGDDGVVRGNIIVDADGRQHQLDTHPPTEFAKRTAAYVIGDGVSLLETPHEVELGRERTTEFLSRLIGRPGGRPIEIIGRMKKLDAGQIDCVLRWLADIRAEADRHTFSASS